MGLADKSIKTIDSVADTIGQVLSRVTGVSRISFAHARLQADGAEIIVSALRSNRKLTLEHLDFSFNQLGDRLVNELIECLGISQPRLRSLNIAAVGMTGRGMADALDRLVGCMELGKNLQTLSVAHNTLGKKVGLELVLFRIGFVPHVLNSDHSTSYTSSLWIFLSPFPDGFRVLKHCLRTSPHLVVGLRWSAWTFPLQDWTCSLFRRHCATPKVRAFRSPLYQWEETR